jgi:hypothetical protein
MTPDGFEVCSPKPCPNFRVVYQKQLASNPDLRAELERLNAMRKIAARLEQAGKPDPAFAKRISREGAELQKKLEAAKIGKFKPGPAAAKRPGTSEPHGSTSRPSDERSFEGLIDVNKYSKNKTIIDRLSRAREFDIGGYHSLTGKGEFGRAKDLLDSDEALQNAYIRMMKDVERTSAATRNNPAVALSKGHHQQIKNLKTPQMKGMTPQQVLDWHLDQMKSFAPDFVIKELRKEAELFIAASF